jgi:hypothetical protein
MKLFKRIYCGLLCVLLVTACKGDHKNDTKVLAYSEPNAKVTLDKETTSEIKVALLLDTSNSMDGLIDQAKAQLWEIVNELSYAKCKNKNPNLKIALYEYGNDNLNADEGYIRQILTFSDDLDEISKSLFSLTTNGGNEYCGKVISSAIHQLNWGDNFDDLKLIFIAGNEPFTQGNVSYKTASQLAHKNNISVNTIFCGDYHQGIVNYWKDAADLTHGDYMAINHNRATVHVTTPYDDKLLELNSKLNSTYVAYGSRGQNKLAEQSVQDNNASSYSKASAVSRTVSKSSKLYKNSSWDLVDAEAEKEFSYADLKQDDLPEELKGKSEKEIKIYVENKRKERNTIQSEIAKLNDKRKIYIKENSKVKNNGLENALIKAIKTQAKKKNYSWEK